jgi:hypothetical protein
MFLFLILLLLAFFQDQLFFYDAVMGVYRTLDHCLYNDIIEMRCRI